MKNKSFAILILTFLSLNLSAQVAEKKSPFSLLLGGALELGGDEVAKIYFTNGEDQSVRAGQGGSVAVGVQYQMPKVPNLLLRATVGIKYVTTQADNAHIRLRRFPLQFTANWVFADKIRIGAGIVSHQSIRFKADGIGPDISFKSANGPIFEIAYRNFGFSYIPMRYKDNTNISYSANAFGLTITTAIQDFSSKKKTMVTKQK